MRRVFTIPCALAVSAAFAHADAQFSSYPSSPSKAPVTAASTSGGWLVGTDDCNLPHRAIPAGDQSGVPFTTGTTSTEGQNEANCYFFGMTGIDNDGWYDWMSTAAGDATVATCGGTTADTKIAVWPGTSSCPADGTSIACNDDACGLQTMVTWSVVGGTTYTLQIGTFPGASGGSGTFGVSVVAPPPCGIYDDGTPSGALGLVMGGEMGWLHNQECFQQIDRVETAYGTAGGSPPPNGNYSAIAVYEDSDCDRDPTTGPPVLVWSLATTVMNAGTDMFTSYPTGGVPIPSRCSWIMATAAQTTTEFPAPMDSTNPTPNAWAVGATPTGATLDISDLNSNSVPPLQTTVVGFPTAWLLRASGVESPPPYPASCFGAGGCPCSNNGDGTGGCENSVGLGGATLTGFGSAMIGADSFGLAASRTTNQPGIFFQGDVNLANPPLFGAGFRCCGTHVVRIGTYSAAANATDTATGNLIGGIGPPVSLHPGNSGLMPGDTRCYQWWYRDPGGPCGASFNLSNSISVTWL